MTSSDSYGRLLLLLTKYLVVSGYHSANSALLLIDRLAASVESFLPSRSRIWRRLASTSRQLTLLTHLKTHLETLLVVTHCEPVSYFTLSFVSLRR